MSSFPESASRLEELEAGLAALQSENYPGAIAQLSDFLASEPDLDQPNAIKAKIGLIRAQIQTGETENAITLCQELQQSQNEKARDWATQTIAKLAPAETGFVPIEPTSTRRKRVQRSQPIPEKTEIPQETQIQSEVTPQKNWQNAGRAQRWQPLRALNPARLQWAELGTVAALFFTLYGLWASAIALSWTWFELRRMLKLSPIVPDGEVPVLGLVLSLGIAFFVSPWLIDAILNGCYGMKSLSTTALSRQSAEAYRLLQRFSQQQKIAIPKLGILPIQAPISFTYGCLPKFARIVVSQGLLDSLTEDEIATIYAGELGHIAHFDFVWMSMIIVMMQIPYTLYQQCNRLLQKQNFPKAVEISLSVISTISYGLFSLFRYSGLWLSRERIAYRDRQACNLTGNPNGLARALVKLSISTHEVIQHEKQTHPVLEGFELLNSVNFRSAITIGNFFNKVPISTLFQWEQANRNRIELMLNQSHSLFGVRLNQIMGYCQEWRITPEFEIDSIPENRQRNLLEIAPLMGTLIGNAIALSLWGIAYGLHSFGIHQFNWLASDYSLFRAFSLIGFGLGMTVRFNQFFPESRSEQTDLVSLFTNPKLMPINSPKIRLEGTLLGRTGANFGQDLMLQTESALVKLNYAPQLSNLFNPLPIGQTAIVTGWFRRGATPLIDVETLRTRSPLHSGQQTGSLLIAIAAILLGLLQVL